MLDGWRLDYNTVRPHGSLQRSTPAQYGAGVPFTPSPERLRNLHPWWTKFGGRSRSARVISAARSIERLAVNREASLAIREVEPRNRPRGEFPGERAPAISDLPPLLHQT